MKKPTFINYSDKIQDLVVFTPDYYLDERGLNFEIYKPNGHDIIHFPFQLDSCSISKKEVLRGFHGDNINWKLIQCLYGQIQLYVIDMRMGSPTYKNSLGFFFDHNSPRQILVPAGVVNAHLCLSDHCVFYYKWSDGYVSPDKQIHVKWNDSRFTDVQWFIDDPILSDRDR